MEARRIVKIEFVSSVEGEGLTWKPPSKRVEEKVKARQVR
jgi:hypothetical protein